MILVDTGPFVALFDPKDPDHAACARLLERVREPLVTTMPVLTEAFHLLRPASRGSAALREFVTARGVAVRFFDSSMLARAFELMEKYSDRPMDLADASLVATAELTGALRVFTIDRDDFLTYRARIGRSYRRFRLLSV